MDFFQTNFSKSPKKTSFFREVAIVEGPWICSIKNSIQKGFPKSQEIKEYNCQAAFNVKHGLWVEPAPHSPFFPRKIVFCQNVSNFTRMKW